MTVSPRSVRRVRPDKSPTIVFTATSLADADNHSSAFYDWYRNARLYPQVRVDPAGADANPTAAAAAVLAQVDGFGYTDTGTSFPMCIAGAGMGSLPRLMQNAGDAATGVNRYSGAAMLSPADTLYHAAGVAAVRAYPVELAATLATIIGGRPPARCLDQDFTALPSPANAVASTGGVGFMLFETMYFTGLPSYFRADTGSGGLGNSGLPGIRPMYTHQYGVDNQLVTDLSEWPTRININIASVQATAAHAAAHGYDINWDLEAMFGLALPVPDSPTPEQQVQIDKVLDAGKAIYDACKAVAPNVLIGFYSAPCEASFYIPLAYTFDPENADNAAAYTKWLARNDRANKRWNGSALVSSPASAWNDYLAPSVYEFLDDTYTMSYAEMYATSNVAMCRQIFPGVSVCPFVSWEYPDFGGSPWAGKQLSNAAMTAMMTPVAACADGWIMWGGYKPSSRVINYKQTLGTGNLAAWQAVTNGVLKVVMAQVGFAVSGLNFSGAASFSAIATILQNAINAELSAGTLTIVSPWTPTNVLPNTPKGTSLLYPWQMGPVTVTFDTDHFVINSAGGAGGTPNGYVRPPDGTPRLTVSLVSYPDAASGVNLVDDAVFIKSLVYANDNPTVTGLDPAEWINGWGTGTGWYAAYDAIVRTLQPGGRADGNLSAQLDDPRASTEIICDGRTLAALWAYGQQIGASISEGSQSRPDAVTWDWYSSVAVRATGDALERALATPLRAVFPRMMSSSVAQSMGRGYPVGDADHTTLTIDTLAQTLGAVSALPVETTAWALLGENKQTTWRRLARARVDVHTRARKRFRLWFGSPGPTALLLAGIPADDADHYAPVEADLTWILDYAFATGLCDQAIYTSDRGQVSDVRRTKAMLDRYFLGHPTLTGIAEPGVISHRMRPLNRAR